MVLSDKLTNDTELKRPETYMGMRCMIQMVLQTRRKRMNYLADGAGKSSSPYRKK